VIEGTEKTRATREGRYDCYIAKSGTQIWSR